MRSMSHRQIQCAALALAALAACSRIGDGAGDGGDAVGLPLADAGTGPDAAAPDGGGAPIERLVVPTDGTAVTTATSLASGTTYRLEVSGTFTWGNCDATNCPGGAACSYQRYGDAYYRSDDCWASTTTGFAYISLYIDGQQVDWGPYSPDHVYAIERSGTGNPFALQVMDCEGCYLDNSGELALEVYVMPGG